MMDPQAYDSPPRRSWWSRNWLWVVPLGCLLPLLVMGGCVAAVVMFAFGALKSSDAYTQSLAAIRADRDVQAALGQPIEPSFLVVGGIDANSQGTGHAELVYSVSGPKGTGFVHVAAEKEAGKWVFKTLTVQDMEENGGEIDVLANQQAEQAADESN